MSKHDPKFRRFANLEGYLEKLSTNLLLGFQPKYWKILDNGSKIGYSNKPDEPIKSENIFLVKDCLASEGSSNTLLELEMRDRNFVLRAPNEEERTDWIKGLTFLKKVATNQIKVKIEVSPTQTTIASHSEKPKHKKPSKIQAISIIPVEKPRPHQPQDLVSNQKVESELISQLVKYLPEKCLKYYTLITSLKVRSQGLFLDSFNLNTYVLVSPKSLYPDLYIGEENLTNISLPPWLEVNYFYKISNSKDKKEKEKRKQIFHISKIIDISDGSEKCSIKINTGEVIYQFFAETLEQKQCLESCLRLAADNAVEVSVNGKPLKRNFDKLIELHETKLPQFEEHAKKIVLSFMKEESQQKYQPKQLFQFLDKSMIFLHEFIEVLEQKRKNKDHVILDMLKLFHEQVKTQAKLTWDSSFFRIKGSDILNMLKKLSQYYNLLRKFIKSSEFEEGMKELSKIYVRESWKNFESIIFGIVQQQKKSNILEDQYSGYLQTYGTTDLFKFIYSVFDLAYPTWKSKIHLHNVNRLMQRALQVFVHQLRSAINQQVIPEKQLIALANNYFSFSDNTKEFYTDKFEELVERTQQSYEKITSSYREVSMIILEKIASRVGSSIEQYCLKCTIQSIKSDEIEDILYKQILGLQKTIHMAFQKKLHQKIMKQVHLKICWLLVQQTKAKKKIKLKQIIRCVKELKTNLGIIFDAICKGKDQIDKKMTELETLLSVQLYADIQSVIASSSEPLKSIYLKILELREDDFTEGSVLYKLVHDRATNGGSNQEIHRHTTRAKISIDAMAREDRATLSRHYFQEQFMDSDQNSYIQEKIEDQKSNVKKGSQNRLINQGYLTKGKRNQKVWQKQYFRLKNGFLYIFQSQNSERCRNSIQIKNILKIEVTNPEKPSFLLTYRNNIGKEKQIKLKASSVELKQRWVNSLQLEKKRMLNEQQVKKKSIKYRQTQATGRKRNQMIIDYEELEKGRDYFSYSS